MSLILLVIFLALLAGIVSGRGPTEGLAMVAVILVVLWALGFFDGIT